MPRKRTSRVYQKRGRYYGDFRDYADVGGGQEALKQTPNQPATTDADVAADLAAARVRQLEKARRKKQLTGVPRQSTLVAFADYHLEQKKLTGKMEDSSLESSQLHLEDAAAFFGDRELEMISVGDVQAWTLHLLKKPSGRRGNATLSPTSARKYLNSLSNLYRRAAGEGYVPPGYNPVAAMMDKPSGTTSEEAEWLEAHEMALFLEAARHYSPLRMYRGLQYLRPIPPEEAAALVATFALTGGRESEVLGLAGADVSFDRGTIAFRPSDLRRLKTRTSWRSVPLWPQLREILQPYMFSTTRGPLLFPSSRLGPDKMITDIRGLLDSIAAMCGWSAGEIRSKMFRHSYCAARLQTADRVLKPGRAAGDPDAFEWIPVSPFTVGKEMGHGGDALVKRVYGHIGTMQHRAEVVEFRVEQHAERLGERLAALRSHLQAERQCRAIGWNGKRCKVSSNLSKDGLCLWHDPERRELAHSKRPHARPLRESRD